MDKRYVENFVARGELILSSRTYLYRQFQSMETKNPFIFDPDEGKINLVQSRELLTQSATEGDKAILKRHFEFEPDETHRGIFRGNIITEHAGDFFMFCLTSLAPAAGKDVFCKETPGFIPYDACVKISNVSEFFMDLWIGAHTAKTFPTGRIVDIHRDFDTDPKRDRVTYQTLDRDWEHGLERPTPFNKDPIFREQKEYRMVIFPTMELSYDRIKLTSPAITKHLKRVM